jgi:hypothetical protein
VYESPLVVRSSSIVEVPTATPPQDKGIGSVSTFFRILFWHDDNGDLPEAKT